jgi:hypothetical protein
MKPGGRDWEPRALGDFSPSPNIRARPEDYPINDDNSPIKVANFDGSIGWLACYGERESCAGFERSAGKQSAMAEEKLDLGWRKRRLDSACALPHRRRTPGTRHPDRSRRGCGDHQLSVRRAHFPVGRCLIAAGSGRGRQSRKPS